MSTGFPHIRAHADRFCSANLAYCTSEEGLVDLFCRDCDFFKEGEDEDLECGAFRILKHLLLKGIITPEDVVRAVAE